MKIRVFLCGLLVALPVFAFDVPSNDGFVTDEAGILTQSEEGALERTLSEYRDATTNEIAILIVSNLEGEDIADTAVDVAREWGVGSEKDNGIFFLISYEDREMFLATGYGLEGALPDIVAAGILDTVMRPRFRDGDYFLGLVDGIEAVQKHVEGEYTADRYASDDDDFASGLGFLIIIALQLLVAILGKSKSWWLGGVFGAIAGVVCTILWGWWLSIPAFTLLGLLLDFVVSNMTRGRGSHFWTGGGRGGGGGGGFGGFGGGSFGGGGARGRW